MRRTGEFLGKLGRAAVSAISRLLSRIRSGQERVGPFCCPNGHLNSKIAACIIDIVPDSGNAVSGQETASDLLPIRFPCAECGSWIKCRITAAQLLDLSP